MINRIAKLIISWANANSGFFGMLGLLFSSGLVTRYFALQTPKELWGELKRIWKSGKALGRRIYQIAKRVIKYVIKVLARICFAVAFVYILIVSVLLHGGEQTVSPKMEPSITTNHVKLDAKGPLETRVQIPETSLYPEVDMMAAEMTDRGNLPWDAISTAFISNDPKEMVEELELDILKNPLVGDMVVQGFGIIENYSTDMYTDYMGSKSWTEAIYREFHGTWANGRLGLSHWLATYEFDDGMVGTYVTDDYRRYAELICQHLDSYYILGFAQEKAEMEYRRSYALTIDDLRAIPFSDGEVRKALVFSKYDDSKNPIDMIGFAVKDKSLIIYEIAGKG